MIAHSNTVHFAPLLFYSLRSKGGKVMEAKQPSKDEIATNSLKNMLGLGQTERVSWGPKQQNVVPSLSDIQKQQSRGKR